MHRDGAEREPEVQQRAACLADANYGIAVNVRSVDGSDVLAHYDPDFTKPTKRDLASLAAGKKGFTALPTGPGGQGLDYLRDDLFPIDVMALIPTNVQPITAISLGNLLDAQIKRAKADQGAVVIAFGEFFRDPGRDSTFGFSPELGVHDIHMMQGNRGSFADDNRINGDGALFIRFADGETVALFVRFTSQSTTTDDRGNPK